MTNDSSAPPTLSSHTDNLNTTPPTAIWMQAWQWFCKHPTLASALITAFSGLVILAYLVPLGFVPDFDLASALGVLAVAALLGAFSVATLAITLLAPAMLGRMLAGSRNESPWRNDAPYFVMALLASLFWFAAFWLNVTRQHTWMVWLFAIVLACTLLAALNRQTLTPRWFKASWFGFLLLLSMQGLSLLGALGLFIPGALKGLANIAAWQQWLMLMLWCLLVGFFNTVLLRARNMTLEIGSIFAVVIVFALIMLTRNPYYLYVMPIQHLKLGNIENATVTVSKPAAAVLQAACRRVADVPRACARQSEELAADYISYENITILSRLGNQYYLQLCQRDETAGPCATETGVRVAIDKKDAGWSIQGESK